MRPVRSSSPQGGQEGERHRAGASEAHYQLQLHLGGRPLEAQPDPGLHRPVHPELHRWEDFATRLDRPLAQFIQLYQPAFFERIGLRYVNAVSRQRLGLEGELWDDLIRSQYIGILGEPDVEESEIAKCSLDVETPLVGDYRMKLHAGPGLIGGGKTDKEVKFILDGDFSTAGKHNPDAVPEKLERMHRFAVCLFQGAITKELHEAMGPTPLAE